MDNELNWIRYEDEEAEVGLEIADMVFEDLIIGVIDDCIKLNNK